MGHLSIMGVPQIYFRGIRMLNKPFGRMIYVIPLFGPWVTFVFFLIALSLEVLL